VKDKKYQVFLRHPMGAKSMFVVDDLHFAHKTVSFHAHGKLYRIPYTNIAGITEDE
jgi:hypothetical protein